MLSPFSYHAPSSYRILSFARVLKKSGHDVTIILPCYDRYSTLKIEYTENNGIKLISPFQFKTKKLHLNSVPYSLASLLKEVSVKADIFHILKPTPLAISGYATKLLRGLAVIQDIDDLDHLVMKAEGHSALSTWVMQQCEQIIPRFADRIVISNSGLKNYYEQIGLTCKMSMIPNGVFIDEFVVERDVRLKEHYSLKDKVITYVGSLNIEAQLRPLILSMQKVVNERKDVSCLIVGDGPARKNLQQLVDELKIRDMVVFVGKVPHCMVPNFLSISDIGYACFPSLDYLNYVSNIKVFEYMAAGVVPIVNQIGDLPYYVDYGNAGVISQPNAQMVSRTILDLLADDKRRSRLRANAREYSYKFDWNNLTKQLYTLYRSLV